MTSSNTTQDDKMACVVPQKTRATRLRRRLGRCAAGISAAALGITVAAMAAAQTGGSFKLAPLSAEAEAEAEAAAADGGIEMILGVSVNTLFFVAAAAVALFWFTLGGGRKPKVSRNG